MENIPSKAKEAPSLFVAKAALPNIDTYIEYVRDIFHSRQFSNKGKFSHLLEKQLSKTLQVQHISLCTNGTIALQLAIRAAKLNHKKVITSPFSYVATVGSLLWEHAEPVFADIDEETLCISPTTIAKLIDKDTAAILGVHVYGNACDVEAIGTLANEHDLRVIYDGAHAFGCQFNGKSLFEYGDYSTLSFHATKLFHTGEGGCIVSQSQEAKAEIDLLGSFGHLGDTHHSIGINGKMSELHAALGLCLLDDVDSFIEKRKHISQHYDSLLAGCSLARPKKDSRLTYNYVYYPVIFESEQLLHKAIKKMFSQNIIPRRYFYPSLNELPYLNTKVSCPVSESISRRVLCLPLFVEMTDEEIEAVANCVKSAL